MINETKSETTYKMALNGFKLNDTSYKIRETIIHEGIWKIVDKMPGNLNYIFPLQICSFDINCISILNQSIVISSNSSNIIVTISFDKEINTIALANLLIGYRKNTGTENDQLRNLEYLIINNCILDSGKTDIIKKKLELPEATKIIINKQ